jgi:hypothetical protein
LPKFCWCTGSSEYLTLHLILNIFCQFWLTIFDDIFEFRLWLHVFYYILWNLCAIFPPSLYNISPGLLSLSQNPSVFFKC